jgi:hypothetical protein
LLIFGIAIGQQDIIPTRDCRLKVSVCWTGKEAQGYEQGMFHPKWYLSSHIGLPEFQVNSDILGGLIVEIGDRTIDLSVSARIAKMNKLLTDTL